MINLVLLGTVGCIKIPAPQVLWKPATLDVVAGASSVDLMLWYSSPCSVFEGPLLSSGPIRTLLREWYDHKSKASFNKPMMKFCATNLNLKPLGSNIPECQLAGAGPWKAREHLIARMKRQKRFISATIGSILVLGFSTIGLATTTLAKFFKYGTRIEALEEARNRMEAEIYERSQTMLQASEELKRIHNYLSGLETIISQLDTRIST